MAQLFTNNAVATIASSITNVATSITLAAGKGALFPTPSGGDFFLATLYELSGTSEVNHEIVRCTARSTDTLTVTRAQEGTTGRAFNAGTAIELRLTASSLWPASGVNNVPSGNLAASTVQAALNELQSDIDTRATSSSLSSHTGATTGAHGMTAFGADLVDSADASAARGTLGLGSAATTASTAYATAAQGTTADNALPKAGGTMSGDIAMGNNDVTGAKTVVFNGTVENSGSTTATYTTDFSTGQKQKLTLTGTITATLAFSFPGAGHYQLH